MVFFTLIESYGVSPEFFVEIVAAFALIGVLIATVFKEMFHSKYQTKMDYVRFYNDLDLKLRNTDRNLREKDLERFEIYHNMIQIVITVMHIIKFQENMKIKFDMEYFRGWIRLGYAFTEYLENNAYFDVDQDDQDIAKELRDWCKKKESESKMRKMLRKMLRKKKGKEEESEKEKRRGKWEKKRYEELPKSVRCLKKNNGVKNRDGSEECEDTKWDIYP